MRLLVGRYIKFFYVGYLLSVVYHAAFYSSLAFSDESTLSIDEWFEEYKIKHDAIISSYPTNLIIIDEIDDDEVKFMKIYGADRTRYHFLKFTSEDSINYFIALNRKPDDLTVGEDEDVDKSNSKTKWIPFLFKSQMVDTIVYISDGKWSFYRLSQDRKISRYVFKSKNFNTTIVAMKHIQRRLRRILGYDGVILDRKGDFVLIGMLAPIRNESAQAVVLSNSCDKLGVRRLKKKVAGILEVDKVRKNIGIFRLIMEGRDDSAIEKGCKIMMQEREK